MVRWRRMKTVFYAISFLLWLAICGLGLECGTRLQTLYSDGRGYALPLIAQAEQEDLAIYEDTAPAAPRPPAEIEAKYPALEALDGASEAERSELARRWEALILRCDIQGNIVERYSAAHPQTTAELAAKAANAANIAELLPGERPEYGKDIVSRLQRAVDDWRTPKPAVPHAVGATTPWVDYMIPFQDIPYAGFRFMFRAFTESGDTEPKVFAVVIPWRWQAFGGGYRPNYYERDAYLQFPKSEFWTNSRGFRDEEIRVPKPQGVYRIVCIGGSTTLEGPRNDLTYPKMLQQLLRAHFQTNAIEVINCGVDGGTIRGQTVRFEDYTAIEPDLIIHYNFANDVPLLMDAAFNRTVLTTPWRRAVFGILSESRFLSRRCRWLWSAFMPSRADYRRDNEEHLVPSLREMLERTRQSGARFAVASFAHPEISRLPAIQQEWFRGHFWPILVIRAEFDDYAVVANAFNDAVRAFCEREGALYVPVAEEIQGGLETYTDHCHLHLPGIRHKAQIMFDHLKATIATDLQRLQQPPLPPPDGRDAPLKNP